MFIREDFPAPEGPMIAISSPLLNFPDMPVRRTFCPVGENSNHHPKERWRKKKF